jgi:hypothetical protein
MGELSKEPNTRRWWPCNVRAQAFREPVFERFGLMPDQPHSWIWSGQGVRQLQHLEWAKGKGVPLEWITGPSDHSRLMKEPYLRHCTSYHVLVAVLDEIESWI